jgi:Protein of unknown function (DUF3379)
MNCLEYRRLLLAEGREADDDDMKLHRLQCAACAQLLTEHEAFEAELRLGLEVPVPQRLEERLVSFHVIRRRRFLAAAGVAALAAGAGAYTWLAREDPLALACIQFVMKEEAKSIMMGGMPREQAAAALAATLPIERIERVGQIRFVGPCPFNGHSAYHLVLAVPQGKVTLLVMPEARLTVGRRAAHEGLYASVMPLKSGSVGIVGSDPDVVSSVAGALKG